jgi:hypothetical protein
MAAELFIEELKTLLFMNFDITTSGLFPLKESVDNIFALKEMVKMEKSVFPN